MSLEAQIQITNPTGLHARPAVKLAQLAAGFDANVEVRVGDAGDWVKARSTAKVMKLKAGVNTTLHFRAEGTQASDALNSLLAFVSRDFDEGPRADEDERPTDNDAQNTGTDAPSPVPLDDEQAISGEAASPGLVKGQLFVLGERTRAGRAAGSPERERETFQRSVDTAAQQLQGLMSDPDDIASQVLAFQIGLLRDPEFIDPVLTDITQGTAADQAWDQHLRREIADYETADTAYFRDRAADLRDLHERVAGVLSHDAINVEVPGGAILVTEELTPSRFLEYDWTRLAGIVSHGGSPTSHVAMLARSRGVPFVVKLARRPAELQHASAAILDAERGLLLLEPTEETERRYDAIIAEQKARAAHNERFLAQPARTADGEAINVYVNVDDPAMLDGLAVEHCDGIGLTRTEFMFHGHTYSPSEASQYAVYRRLLEWAQGRPVTIRTLDAGGDKPIPGLTPDDEQNPFLGVRGVRLSLTRPEVFRVQLRALARAAVHGKLKVMLPMVTVPEELEQTRALLDEELANLSDQGIAASRPLLGIMIEVPAAALTVAQFNADFFSIGTNDLVQYVMAAGRDCVHPKRLQDPLHPAVMELIHRVADHGAVTGTEVSVCGEMAAMPAYLAPLIKAGVRSVSVPPAQLAATKAAIAAS